MKYIHLKILLLRTYLFERGKEGARRTRGEEEEGEDEEGGGRTRRGRGGKETQEENKTVHSFNKKSSV